MYSLGGLSLEHPSGSFQEESHGYHCVVFCPEQFLAPGWPDISPTYIKRAQNKQHVHLEICIRLQVNTFLAFNWMAQSRVKMAQRGHNK